MAERKEKWSIKKSAPTCFSSGYNFKNKDFIISQIVFINGEYERRDFCEKNKPDTLNEISTWRTQFILPLPKEEIIKKEGIEGLLHKFILEEEEKNTNIIYILAVMLERKKVFKEQEVNLIDDHKIRIYEHRKTNEIFLIKDPMLNLDEIDDLTEEVALLLGGKPKKDINNNLGS